MRFAKVIAATAFIAAPVLVSAPPAHAATQTISGTITCINFWQQYSQPVGVWVDAARGTDGWASLRSASGANGAWTSSFSYSSNDPGTFTLKIGCGGTPQKWQTSNQRGPYNPGTQNITVRY